MIFAAACSTSGPQQQQRLSDQEVAMVMRVLNIAEIREATLMRDKATDKTLKDFAQRLINDHEAQMNKAEADLLKANIESEDSTLSRELDAKSGAARERLQQLSGAEFDRAYIDREITANQTAIKLIDERLVPSAHKKIVGNAALALKKLIEIHLDEAKKIQANLK
jgi:putative membrane protein